MVFPLKVTEYEVFPLEEISAFILPSGDERVQAVLAANEGADKSRAAETATKKLRDCFLIANIISGSIKIGIFNSTS